MMKPLRYAIIGCGMMGHEHLRNIALLRARELVDAEVVALIEPNDEMRDSALQLARSLGNREVLALPHHSQLRQDTADALVVVTPNHTHREVLVDLLPGGLPILAEKPICTTLAHCEEIVALAAGRSAPFWVAMEYRYMPPTARFLERLGNGDVGQLHMLSIREHRYPFLKKVDDWNRFNANTGGTLIEKCCHHFDLMRLATGAEPTRVFASGGMDVNHLEERYDGRTPDILDNAMIIVDFDNGSRAALELCMFAEGAEPQEQLTAIGSKGKLDALIPGPDRFWPDAEHSERPAELIFSSRCQTPQEREAIRVDPAIAAAGDHHGSTFYQHQKFAMAVLDGEPVEVSLSDGVCAVRMGDAAQRSIQSGAVVSLM